MFLIKLLMSILKTDRLSTLSILLIKNIHKKLIGWAAYQKEMMLKL